MDLTNSVILALRLGVVLTVAFNIKLALFSVSLLPWNILFFANRMIGTGPVTV
jgi:hypothetical protein